MGLFSKAAAYSGPSRPFGQNFAGWEAATAFMEVEDDPSIDPAIQAIFADRNLSHVNGAEVDDWAYLVRDMTDTKDSTAVSVWVRGYWLGRLKAKNVIPYLPELNGLYQNELNLAVPVHLWAQQTPSKLARRITLKMPPAAGAGLVNHFPSRAYAIFPPGPRVPLVDFSTYAAAVAGYASVEGPVPLALVLKSEGDVVYAFSGRDYVGQFGAADAANIGPLVRSCEAKKLLPVARGVLMPTAQGLDLWVSCAGRAEVGQNWSPNKAGGK